MAVLLRRPPGRREIDREIAVTLAQSPPQCTQAAACERFDDGLAVRRAPTAAASSRRLLASWHALSAPRVRVGVIPAERGGGHELLLVPRYLVPVNTQPDPF